MYVHARPHTCMRVICNKACIKPRGVAHHPVWSVTLYLCLILLRPGPAGVWKATVFQIGTATPGFKVFHSCMASVLPTPSYPRAVFFFYLPFPWLMWASNQLVWVTSWQGHFVPIRVCPQYEWKRKQELYSIYGRCGRKELDF